MTEQDQQELAMLKERATQLGIKYKENIGLDTLRARVNAKVKGEPEPEETSEDSEVRSVEVKPLEGEAKAQYTAKLKRRQARKLVRVKVTCMNPTKKEWKGEIFDFSNKVVGNIRKFVPFNEEWHVPQALLNMIKERKYQAFKKIKTPKGDVPKGFLNNEFAIEYLDNLTEQELKDLARLQLARSQPQD